MWSKYLDHLGTGICVEFAVLAVVAIALVLLHPVLP